MLGNCGIKVVLSKFENIWFFVVSRCTRRTGISTSIGTAIETAARCMHFTWNETRRAAEAKLTRRIIAYSYHLHSLSGSAIDERVLEGQQEVISVQLRLL